MTWTEAKSYCESRGGHLATITSSGEQDAIVQLIQNGTQKQYWLGGTVVSRRGSWITGEAFSYSNWGSGEPNNYRSNENYIEIYRLPNPHSYQSNALGKWNDISVDNHISGEEDFFTTSFVGLICEFDSSLTDIAKASVSLGKTEYTYSGKERKPSVTVRYNSKKLQKNKDYTVSYSNNTEIGKASVTVKGIGSYTGSQTCRFTIIPTQVKKLSLDSPDAGKLSASWKAVKGSVTGYEIQYWLTKKYSI